MRKTIFLLFMLFSLSLQAQRSFELPNSADGESKLYVYLPSAEKSTGRAIVCCPGGGYAHLAMTYEGTDWAPYFNDMGIALIVLKYRMPHGDRNIPIGDAERAMVTVRDSASTWNINPYDVGIMGFSAGGHLATTIATHSGFKARPNFQVLFYPVVSMDKKKGHRGSSENFLGSEVDSMKVVNAFSNEQHVTKHFTPPAILFMADDDTAVPVLTNGVPYYIALRSNHVTASMHIYPRGGHGWRPERFPYYDDMLKSLREWLTRLPSAKADALRVACVGNSITYGSGIDLTEIKGYPAQLQQLLGSGYHVRNYGLGARTMLSTGDHPYMIEPAWAECKEFNPNIVIVKLGTNDSKDYNWNAPQYEKDMQSMIDQLNSLPSKPRILLGFPAKAWRDKWGITDKVITEEVIPIISKVAKRNNLETIDFHTATSTNSGLFTSDMIHPNEKGAKVMAELAKKAILREP